MTIFLILIVFGLGGCTTKNQVNVNNRAEYKIEENVVTKTGILKTKVGDEWLLSVDGEIVNVTSNKYDLDELYWKKN